MNGSAILALHEKEATYWHRGVGLRDSLGDRHSAQRLLNLLPFR